MMKVLGLLEENDSITAENAARQLIFASMLMYELDEALEREENSNIVAVEKSSTDC